MILVNISAVETSMTFTLQPVSSSHFGPEKFLGSSDCRPASQTMVMVLPAQIFLAASTARWAALWAATGPEATSAAMARAGSRARPPMASRRGTALTTDMVGSPLLNRCLIV